jgi:hypothetical protein
MTEIESKICLYWIITRKGSLIFLQLVKLLTFLEGTRVPCPSVFLKFEQCTSVPVLQPFKQNSSPWIPLLAGSYLA